VSECSSAALCYEVIMRFAACGVMLRFEHSNIRNVTSHRSYISNIRNIKLQLVSNIRKITSHRIYVCESEMCGGGACVCVRDRMRNERGGGVCLELVEKVSVWSGRTDGGRMEDGRRTHGRRTVHSHKEIKNLLINRIHS
jgi:hypothetical protein